MPLKVKYLHTNLTVRDLDRMRQFYCDVFGFVPVREPQSLEGQWLDEITGIPAAKLRYVHLRFPACAEDGPQLELNCYDNPMRQHAVGADQLGFGHISFAVENVESALQTVIAAGGGSIGSPVTNEIPGRGTLTEVYATDPEGNIVELQHYS